MEWLVRIIENTDIAVAILTIYTVIVGLIKNYLVAIQKLKPTYILMIFLGFGYIGLNSYIALNNPGEEIVLLMSIPGVWLIVMGIKGLKHLKEKPYSHDYDGV